MKNLKKKYWIILFLCYIAVLFRITVFRSSFNLANILQNGTINLTLFQDFIPLIAKGRWFMFIYLFVGNIVWFIPLGIFLMASGTVRRIPAAVLCGLGLSLVIETLQYIFGTGVSELDDLVLNSLGTLIGAVMVWGLRRLSVLRGKS